MSVAASFIAADVRRAPVLGPRVMALVQGLTLMPVPTANAAVESKVTVTASLASAKATTTVVVEKAKPVPTKAAPAILAPANPAPAKVVVEKPVEKPAEPVQTKPTIKVPKSALKLPCAPDSPKPASKTVRISEPVETAAVAEKASAPVPVAQAAQAAKPAAQPASAPRRPAPPGPALSTAELKQLSAESALLCKQPSVDELRTVIQILGLPAWAAKIEARPDHKIKLVCVLDSAKKPMPAQTDLAATQRWRTKAVADLDELLGGLSVETVLELMRQADAKGAGWTGAVFASLVRHYAVADRHDDLNRLVGGVISWAPQSRLSSSWKIVAGLIHRFLAHHLATPAQANTQTENDRLRETAHVLTAAAGLAPGRSDNHIPMLLSMNWGMRRLLVGRLRAFVDKAAADGIELGSRQRTVLSGMTMLASEAPQTRRR